MHDLPAPRAEIPIRAGDPLARMRSYSLAADLLNAAWSDASRLCKNPVTFRVASQLYAAVGSIAANLGEGYSRNSGADRARFFEYALGSVREATVWYRAAAPVLGHPAVEERLDILVEIRRLLLATIPRERAHGNRDRNRSVNRPIKSAIRNRPV